MSTQAINWALDDVGKIKPSQKAVLFALANYAGADGTCWPSQETIARQCCMGERTVRRCLKDLEQIGILSRETRFNPATMRRKTDVITLNLAYKNAQPPSPSEGLPDNPPARMAAGPETGENPPAKLTAGEKATGQTRQFPPARLAAKPSVDPSDPTTTPKAPKTTKAKPTQIPEDWQPSERIHQWAEKNNIPRDFYEPLIDEFVIYWTDAGKKKASWDATFMNLVKMALKRAEKEKPGPAGPGTTVGGRNGKNITGRQQRKLTPAEQAEQDALAHLESIGALSADAGTGAQVFRLVGKDGADIPASLEQQDGEGRADQQDLLPVDGKVAGGDR